MSDRLTAAQRRALKFLSANEWLSPSRLGELMSDRPRIKAQGAGRIGGVMGTRLAKMGLARHHWHNWGSGRSSHFGYEITEAGRRALEERK